MLQNRSNSSRLVHVRQHSPSTSTPHAGESLLWWPGLTVAAWWLGGWVWVETILNKRGETIAAPAIATDMERGLK